MRSYRDEIINFVKKEYKTVPECPWAAYPSNVVLRHNDNKKWYAIIMEVKREVLGLEGSGTIDVMNVKLDPFMIDMLVSQEGYMRGYHMNKKYWMTIFLDGTVPKENIQNLLEQSFDITASKKKK